MNETINFVLANLVWSLKHGDLAAHKITAEYLDKDKHANLGAVHVSLTKRSFVEFLHGLTRDMPPGKSRDDLLQMFSHFDSHDTFQRLVAAPTIFDTGPGKSALSPPQDAPSRARKAEG